MTNKKTSKLLSVDKVIEIAKKEGVDFGSGKPYNRLRYYTKLNWIPHMERKGKNVEGHYPYWVINRLKLIQKLKDKGLSNEEITEEIEKREKFKAYLKPLDSLKSRETQTKIMLVVGLIVVSLVILSRMEIIQIGKSMEDITPQQQPLENIFP